jgi:hypothetical protein
VANDPGLFQIAEELPTKASDLSELKAQLGKDLGCQLSGDSAIDLIKSVLAFLEGAAHSSIDIPSLLYQIDVPEQELAQLLARFGHRETECQAYVIIKREWEKV